MNIFRWFTKKNLCGLDLGSSWVKIVSLSPGTKGVLLQRIGRFAWKTTDREQPETLGQKLAEFWTSLGLGKQGVVSAIPGYEVIIKKIDLEIAKIAKSKLDEEIKTQAKQYIPFNINDVYLDYQVLSQDATKQKNEIILVASKKKTVQELQDIFAKAKLGLNIVDVDGFALTNCFETNYPELSGESNFILDIGFGHSTFCAYEPGKAPFTRDVSFGIKQLNKGLIKVLDKRPAEIEKIKIAGPKDLSAEEKQTLHNELDRIYASWAEEILRLINFYLTSVSEGSQPSQRLFLSGGGSFLSGICNSLKQHLNLETHLLNSFKEIQCPEELFDEDYLQYIAPQFAIAVGLALRTLN